MTARLVKDRVSPGDGDSRHGRVSTYNSHGCRCDACRAAVTAYAAALRARRRAHGEVPDHAHGRSGHRNWACHCDVCRAGLRASMAAFRSKKRAGDAPDGVHGTTNGYGNYGCRCDACRAAQAAYKADYRNRKQADRHAETICDAADIAETADEKRWTL